METRHGGWTTSCIARTTVEYADGGKGWYVNGKLHRDNDKPAVEYADGTKEWWVDGKRHRDNDMPAVERTNGDNEWWVDGWTARRTNGGLCRDNGEQVVERMDGGGHCVARVIQRIMKLGRPCKKKRKGST